ncbi:MAG: AMP-binding protein [Chloroflexi bacterium]|nr:AMP-binding protein [Chloroflexota bacterium]
MEWHSIGHLLDEASQRFGTQPLFVFEGQSLSFVQVNRKVNQSANSLRSSGVTKGMRVAVMLPNGIDFPITWFALAKLGAVIVPININYHDRDLAYTLNDSQAGFFMIHNQYLPQWQRVREHISAVREIFIIGSDTDFSQRAEQASAVFNGPDIGPDDLVNIQYTSGTTGFPKGCMLTHDYWLRVGQIAAEYFELEPGEVNLTAQPFYYMDPQWNAIACLIGGARLVILPRFSPSHFWQTLIEHKVTVLYLIGTMPFFLLKQDEQPALEHGHHLRVILCSGIHPKFHAEFERRWGVPWREAYGMTETGVDLIVPLDDAESVGSGAMGKPIASKRVRVVNAEGQDVLDGQVGELLISGKPMMLGYWNNPTATAETLIDGWLHTGDLVSRDERGYYHWQARLKDTIRRAGENIAAVEVESVLLEHPAVHAVAVVPVPDELRGQEVKAYIALRPEYAPDPEAILDYAREQLAYFKVPRYVEFVDDLPRTASERVEKHKLINNKPDLRIGSYDAVDKVWR